MDGVLLVSLIRGDGDRKRPNAALQARRSLSPIYVGEPALAEEARWAIYSSLEGDVLHHHRRESPSEHGSAAS